MTQGAGKRTRSRHCLTDQTEEVDCGYVWADWATTWATEKDKPSSCDANGNTSRFSRLCIFKNQSNEIESSVPSLTNCADEADIVRRSRAVMLDPDPFCGYLTLRDENEINGQVIGQHALLRVLSKLKFDLFLKPGSETNSVQDIINIVCSSCENNQEKIKIQTKIPNF